MLVRLNCWRGEHNPGDVFDVDVEGHVSGVAVLGCADPAADAVLGRGD